jgi:hypothetical protein
VAHWRDLVPVSVGYLNIVIQLQKLGAKPYGTPCVKAVGNAAVRVGMGKELLSATV